MNEHEQTLEALLRQANTDADARRALPQALRLVEVICLGEYALDDQQRPWTQINGYAIEGNIVLPCFLSEQALHAVFAEDTPSLVVFFADFVRAALGHGVPVVIDPDLPHAYLIPHDALCLYHEGGDGTITYGRA